MLIEKTAWQSEILAYIVSDDSVLVDAFISSNPALSPSFTILILLITPDSLNLNIPARAVEVTAKVVRLLPIDKAICGKFNHNPRDKPKYPILFTLFGSKVFLLKTAPLRL